MTKRIGIRTFLLIALASNALAQDSRPVLYRVNDNLYRGKQPARQDIPKLATAGIKTVLDLRGSLGHKNWEKTAVEGAGMRYVRVGLSGVFAPTDSQIDRILAILKDGANGPIFIHCRRGADRSGVVIACYRISHDHWTNAQAMEEARQQGFSGELALPSPTFSQPPPAG